MSVQKAVRISFNNPEDNHTYYGFISLTDTEAIDGSPNGGSDEGYILYQQNNNSIATNSTSAYQSVYDYKGALLFVIAVVLVYGMSIVLLIASHLTRRPAKIESDKQIERYLQDFQIVKEKEAMESYRMLKRAIAEKIQWERQQMRRIQRVQSRRGKSNTKFRLRKRNPVFLVGVAQKRYHKTYHPSVLARGGLAPAVTSPYSRKMSISMDFKTFEKQYAKLSDHNLTLEVLTDDEHSLDLGYGDSLPCKPLSSPSKSQYLQVPQMPARRRQITRSERNCKPMTKRKKKVHFFLEDETLDTDEDYSEVSLLPPSPDVDIWSSAEEESRSPSPLVLPPGPPPNPTRTQGGILKKKHVIEYSQITTL